MNSFPSGTRVVVTLHGDKVVRGKLTQPYLGEGPVYMLSASGKAITVPAEAVLYVQER